MQSFKEFGEYILKNSRHGENPSDWVHIILNYPKIEWDEWAEYMATLTWFSGIPLSRGGSKNHHVIFAETIDEALSKVDQYKYAMISYIGSFYYTDRDQNIHTLFDKFRASDHACRGHLLFHPGKQYGRLHPQTIFVNLDHWRKIDKPSFGYHTGWVADVERSTSNVHDDYTPHWIKQSDYGYKWVENAEQAEYISKVLEDGKTILNFDLERKAKFFCYPERRRSDTLDAERNKSSNIVYVKNNENITAVKTDKKFDVIYAPASGYLAENLWKLYGHKDTKLVIYDYNDDSLKWKQMTYQMANTEEDLEMIANYFKKKGCIVDDCWYKPEQVKQNEKTFSVNDYLSAIKQISPEIIKYDILEGPFNVDASKRNLIYLSNIFSYNFIIHKMRVEDVHNVFLKYLALPNTTIYGKNVFKDTVIHENSSS